MLVFLATALLAADLILLEIPKYPTGRQCLFLKFQPPTGTARGARPRHGRPRREGAVAESVPLPAGPGDRMESSLRPGLRAE